MTDLWPRSELHTDAADNLPERLWDYESYPATEEDRQARGAMTGLVDLGFIKAALRRSARIWCLTALAGLLVGAGLFARMHTPYQASVALFMRNDPTVDLFTAMETDAIVAQEPAVAAAALKKLGLDEPAADLTRAYTATITGNQVLTITVIAPTPDLATSESNALAQAFLQIRATMLSAQQRATASAQTQQVDVAQQSYSTIKSEISQLSAQSPTAANQEELKNLESALTKSSALLTSLQQSAAYNQANSQLNTATEVTNSKIMYVSAPVVLHSRKRLALEYIGGVFFGGLVLGLAFVIISAVVSDKLWRRDDVADALGSPVRISVTSAASRRWPLPGARGRLRESDAHRVAAFLRKYVPRDATRVASLAVVVADETGFAASAVAEMAASCAAEGMRVVVTDLCGGTLARALGWKGAQGVRSRQVSGGQLDVIVHGGEDIPPIGPLGSRGRASAYDERTGAYSAADLLITFVSLDPAVGADHLKTWANVVVVMVTAGRSSVGTVRAIGEMIRMSGADLESGVLLGADKTDDSLGLVGV